MSDNSVLGIYTFEGIFEGKAVYEYAYPQEHALHKCMLFLLQEGTDALWDAAIIECAKFGFENVAMDTFSILQTDMLEKAPFKDLHAHIEEALTFGSSLVFYAKP